MECKTNNFFQRAMLKAGLEQLAKEKDSQLVCPEETCQTKLPISMKTQVEIPTSDLNGVSAQYCPVCETYFDYEGKIYTKNEQGNYVL